MICSTVPVTTPPRTASPAPPVTLGRYELLPSGSIQTFSSKGKQEKMSDNQLMTDNLHLFILISDNAISIWIWFQQKYNYNRWPPFSIPSPWVQKCILVMKKHSSRRSGHDKRGISTYCVSYICHSCSTVTVSTPTQPPSPTSEVTPGKSRVTILLLYS